MMFVLLHPNLDAMNTKYTPDQLEAIRNAAPDLLEALKAVLKFDRSDGIPGEYKHDVTLALKVRAAIAKATQP